MKLHEALSTGLPFRFDENADWMELCDDDDLFEVSTHLVLWGYWEVRLPDSSAVVSEWSDLGLQSYLTAKMFAKASGGCTQPTPDAYITTHVYQYGTSIIERLRDGGLSEAKGRTSVCECGSEAIGGGSHSTWCPKVVL